MNPGSMRLGSLTLASLIILAAAYGLNRGLFLGSKIFIDGQWFIKHCHYLYFTGVETHPARGGDSRWDLVPPAPPGSVGDLGRADELHCPVFYR
jgi:hypothetical protein